MASEKERKGLNSFGIRIAMHKDAIAVAFKKRAGDCL